jgi:Cu/Ag efflux pump CusA
MIGGMITATLLSLLVIPAAYRLVHSHPLWSTLASNSATEA